VIRRAATEAAEVPGQLAHKTTELSEKLKEGGKTSRRDDPSSEDEDQEIARAVALDRGLGLRLTRGPASTREA
jgi:hypothetical protein